MIEGAWTINLDEAQSNAMRDGKLRYLRFPREVYEENFTDPKGVIVIDTADHMTAPTFGPPTHEKMGDSSYDTAVGEGMEYYSESYIDNWNTRFPNQPYSKDLETTVVELTWVM
jgi:hypothetical protein